MPVRPAAIAFDMLQTVFSLEPLRETLVGLGLPSAALELWFARTLRDGFALAATDMFRPFRQVAMGTLQSILTEHNLTSRTGEADEVFDAFSSLPAQSDAPDALAAACKTGMPVLALTNGSAESTRQSLEKAGLSDFVNQIVSIDDAKAWKPRAKAYHYAAQVAGVPPAKLALVAVHAWDCHGARAAGLIAGWVSRNEKLFNPAFMAPDVSGASLPEVCNAMLNLPD